MLNSLKPGIRVLDTRVCCLLEMELRTTLLEALQALYHHPEQQVRSAASRWLEDFQHTMEAWQLSDNLLHDPNSSLEVLYFCAQTLRTKIQRDFEDLPPGAGLALRSSLMILIVKFSPGPQAVRTQLCLGMAALAMHMSSDEWGGIGIVKWLGHELGSKPDATMGLLELLAVLPQEAYAMKVTVRPEGRRQFQKELGNSVQEAFALLSSCFGSSEVLREQVLHAFAAWLRLSYGIPAPELASHPLVRAAVSSLQSEQTFDAAVDAVAELIRYTVNGNPRDLAGHMSLVQVLVPCIMGLRPRFALCLKAAIAEKQAREEGDSSRDAEGCEEDDETVKGMAYLFAEMGEAYVDIIASGTDEALMIVGALAEVTSHPDYNIASMTFNFWHRLSRLLTKREHYSQFGIDAAVEGERERRLAVFRPSYRLLVSLVSFRVTYPPDFKTWRKDEHADFRQTRYAVADTLMDATVVLGGEETLKILAEPLLQVTVPTGNDTEWNWRAVEASLYCIRAIAKAVPASEATVMPRIMALLPQLPMQPQLLYTSCLTVAAFADWLGASESSTTLLPMILQLLINALSASEDPSAAAALALKHVCDACRRQLVGSIDSLLAVFRQVMSGEEKFHLNSEDELQLVEGLSMVISALSPEQLSQALQALFYPVLAPLQVLVANTQAGTQITSSQYTILIDKIANMYRYVSQPEPLAVMFSSMWPILREVFSQRAGDVRTMERLCRACKYAVRTCGRALVGAMGPMLEEIQSLFQQHNHPCFLYLASEVIKVFGSDPSCAFYLGNLISVLFSKTFSILKTIEDFTAKPDLADDCFLLASRCIRYCPHLLIPNYVFPSLLDCAMTGITIQHREACTSILTFLRDVVELCISHGGKPFQVAVDAALLPRGPTLTRMLIAALAGALPESRLDEVMNTFLSLARLYGLKVVAWAQDAASLIPASIVTDAEKTSFLQAVSSAASGAESPAVTSSMEEISDVCRRNKKVLEAVQTALKPSQLTLSPAG